MNQLVTAVKRFVSEEEGVTAIEYGLIAALIAVVIITAVTAVGTNLTCVFNKIAACLSDETSATCLADC
ncbi:MAG: Flp family type IVb pilin [Gammaproteobacteria bacterium]|nr:Flp family type IVb pilin [Gammaproteobacteria bacterium]MBU1406547.1 Flp family type IVb pilin [Gammaproteobacteria bacterium]MBU1530855.1 Flp family type IVb pilin [Gammaproteobacteria bacterium]